MSIEPEDQVRFDYVGRLTDGTVFDTSREPVAEETELAEGQPDREYSPLTAEIGGGQLIEGLEEGLIGLEEGDTKTITVPPEMGYGQPREDLIVAYDPSEFKQRLGDAEIEEGMRVRAMDGDVGEILHIDSDVIRVDFNHDLAGESLEFEIEVLNVS